MFKKKNLLLDADGNEIAVVKRALKSLLSI